MIKLSDNALDKFCEIKSTIKYLEEQVTDELKKEVEALIEASSDNKIVHKTYTLELRERADYNYESAQHPEYSVIKNMIEKWEKKKKSLEAFIKKIPLLGTPYVTSSGDKVTLRRAEKSTKNIIYFSENK